MSHQTKHATSRTNGNCEQLKWETRAEAKQEKLAFEASTTKAVYVCATKYDFVYIICKSE